MGIANMIAVKTDIKRGVKFFVGSIRKSLREFSPVQNYQTKFVRSRINLL